VKLVIIFIFTPLKIKIPADFFNLTFDLTTMVHHKCWSVSRTPLPKVNKSHDDEDPGLKQEKGDLSAGMSPRPTITTSWALTRDCADWGPPRRGSSCAGLREDFLAREGPVGRDPEDEGAHDDLARDLGMISPPPHSQRRW